MKFLLPATWLLLTATGAAAATVEELARETPDLKKQPGGNKVRSGTMGVNDLIRGEALRVMLDCIYGRLLTRVQLRF